MAIPRPLRLRKLRDSGDRITTLENKRVANSSSLRRKQTDPSLSIFVIGMRGAGKTTTGRWIASLLSRTFLDLDHDLEARLRLSCSDIVRQRGWEAFREAELNVLADSMQNRRTGYVFSCGGGIVETPEARRLLKSWPGIVMQVSRDTDAMVEYLMIDKTRPVYSEQIHQVYERRKPFLEDLSDVVYLSTQRQVEEDCGPPQDLLLFLDRLYGEVSGHKADLLLARNPLQVWDVSSLELQQQQQHPKAAKDHVANIPNCDALCLRIRLDEPLCLDSLAVHIARLRSTTSMPFILSLEELRALQLGSIASIFRLADRMRVEMVAISSDTVAMDWNTLQRDCAFTQIVTTEDA
ncbi:hypothetical protein NM208_g8795 [Fusarium decemcellulare]|uniref:Uncharacterized protein n=1 Tax=Fusarium decemcellulare TaxID=57161 RepID=A0ACC1S4J4_9HYPO|nr:hypothetical protein NM208_g8795 [Fusarium decemcellulare]